MKVCIIPANGLGWMIVEEKGGEWYAEIFSRLYFQAYGRKFKGLQKHKWNNEDIHHNSQQ